VPDAAGERAWARLTFLVILLFLLVNLPVIAGFNRHTRDERFYVDGALVMLRTGDYLTPRWPDGSARFNKPPLTYWLLAGSYRLFGVSLLASRLPFLLAGCLTLFLAGRLARDLWGSARAGLLAVAVLAANNTFLTNSNVSTTDGLLTLGVILSQLGFMRVVFLGSRARRDYAWAYLGCALAMLAKGLIGLAPAGFAWLFALLLRRRLGLSLRALFNAPALAAGLLLGGGWMLAMLALHGGTFLDEFGGDQVGNRLGRSRWIENLLVYAGTWAGTFLPWYLPLAFLGLADRPALRAAGRGRGARSWYLLAWAAAVALVFLPSNQARARYIMPTVPLLAVLLAGWLDAAEREHRLDRVWRALGWALAALGLAGGAGLAAAGWGGDPWLRSGGLLLVAAGGALGGLLFAARLSRPLLTAAFLLCAYAVTTVCLQSYAKATPAPEVARILKAHAPGDPRVELSADFPTKYLSQVRICMGGLGRFEVRDPAALPGAGGGPDAVLYAGAERPARPPEGYRLVEAGAAYERFDLGEYLRARWQGRAEAYLDRCRTSYCVAVRER
jgi:4-amino-4-deoxy-L-arabinose transferase-like glycosyltransferase